MSTIRVNNLVKYFQGQQVLHGINLEVNPGEVVAIIGPSGSGKTTLLRSINLLEQPEGGSIQVGEITIDTGRGFNRQKEKIRALRQQVGFVFQNFNLFPHRTVIENIIEGPVIVKGVSSLLHCGMTTLPRVMPVPMMQASRQSNCWHSWKGLSLIRSTPVKRWRV